MKNCLKNIFALLGIGDIIVAIFAMFFGRIPNSTEIVTLAIIQTLVFMAIWRD